MLGLPGGNETTIFWPKCLDLAFVCFASFWNDGIYTVVPLQTGDWRNLIRGERPISFLKPWLIEDVNATSVASVAKAAQAVGLYCDPETRRYKSQSGHCGQSKRIKKVGHML